MALLSQPPDIREGLVALGNAGDRELGQAAEFPTDESHSSMPAGFENSHREYDPQCAAEIGGSGDVGSGGGLRVRFELKGSLERTALETPVQIHDQLFVGDWREEDRGRNLGGYNCRIQFLQQRLHAGGRRILSLLQGEGPSCPRQIIGQYWNWPVSCGNWNM